MHRISRNKDTICSLIPDIHKHILSDTFELTCFTFWSLPTTNSMWALFTGAAWNCICDCILELSAPLSGLPYCYEVERFSCPLSVWRLKLPHREWAGANWQINGRSQLTNSYSFNKIALAIYPLWSSLCFLEMQFYNFFLFYWKYSRV